MKALSEYRTRTLIILGDETGRRYSTNILDTAIETALGTLKNYLPHKETVRMKVSGISGREAVLNWSPETGAEILTIRNESGDLLNASDYRTGGRTYLQFYGCGPIPAAGDLLQVELGLPHVIRDLDGARMTTVPDSLMLTVCTGAAGYAMRMRARSVTEVFGKRPEDTENLIAQADTLETAYLAALNELSLSESLHRDPWPHLGFPI